eukprot:NODE_3398_length_2044_cov_8.493479.p1 GENE.NODE_3398_length_2044_cov_8.493479~~NODE_3398_length_2044_cov_8.493479.p1  ORF type:complete len:297 (+),score=60.82 NODE_3398_length_2044_cov_8.493479:59-949(+)
MSAVDGAVAALQQCVRRLEEELQQMCQDRDWYWERCSELRAEMRVESEWWQRMSRRKVLISSPLTKYNCRADEPRCSGWAWSTYEVHCACCKRPLDVTLELADEPAPPAPPVMEFETYDGMELSITAGMRGYEALLRFATTSSSELLSELPPSGIIVAAGPVECIDGYNMVPVRPVGAVDARNVVPVVAPLPLPPESGAIIPTTSGGSGGDGGAAAVAVCRRAYCAVLWGASAGYALGATVLGARLRAQWRRWPRQGAVAHRRRAAQFRCCTVEDLDSDAAGRLHRCRGNTLQREG